MKIQDYKKQSTIAHIATKGIGVIILAASLVLGLERKSKRL